MSERMPRDPFTFRPPSRRELLLRAANGFGAVALASLLAEDGRAGESAARHFTVGDLDALGRQVNPRDVQPLVNEVRGGVPPAQDTSE